MADSPGRSNAPSQFATMIWDAFIALFDSRFTSAQGWALFGLVLLYNVRWTTAIRPDVPGSSSSSKQSPSDVASRSSGLQPSTRSRTVSGDTADTDSITIDEDDNKEPDQCFADSDLEELAEIVPTATKAELVRFLTSKKGNVEAATNTLKVYLEWRNAHAHISTAGEPALLDMDIFADDDWNQWNIAAAAAIKAAGKEPCILPRIARLHQLSDKDIVDKQGHRVLHIIPGQMNEQITSLTVYAVAVALYIDRKLPRDSNEKVSVVIDVRGGVGWRNLHASKLLPFIQTTTKLLLAMFPERLSRAIVYPLPPAFGWIWKLSKRCIDPLTADKICILTGPAMIISPPPVTKLCEYMNAETVALLESQRVASFVHSPDQ
jgi:hypothetical protein